MNTPTVTPTTAAAASQGRATASNAVRRHPQDHSAAGPWSAPGLSSGGPSNAFAALLDIAGMEAPAEAGPGNSADALAPGAAADAVAGAAEMVAALVAAATGAITPGASPANGAAATADSGVNGRIDTLSGASGGLQPAGLAAGSAAAQGALADNGAAGDAGSALVAAGDAWVSGLTGQTSQIGQTGDGADATGANALSATGDTLPASLTDAAGVGSAAGSPVAADAKGSAALAWAQGGRAPSGTGLPGEGNPKTSEANRPTPPDGAVARGLEALRNGESPGLARALGQARRGSADGEAGDETASAGKARVTVGRRVSAAARDAQLSGPPPQSLASTAPAADASTRAWHMALNGQPGSALAPSSAGSAGNAGATGDESAIAALATAATRPEDERRAAREADSPRAPETGPAASGAEASAPHLADPTGPADAGAPAFAQAMLDAYEHLGSQVSVWAGQQVRRANIELDVGRGEPLQVDVSLDGGQAHVDFRTDDEAAQTAIRSQAQDVLRVLLERQGLSLGELSVGARDPGQGQGQAQGDTSGASGGRGLRRALDRVSAAQAMPVAAPIRRSQGALDVFA